MRCLALTEALRSRGLERPCWLTNRFPGKFRMLLEDSGAKIRVFDDWVEGLDFDFGVHLPLEPCVVVVDHYAATSQKMSELRGLGHRLVLIDDLADRCIEADIVVNQNLGAGTLRYNTLNHPVILSGCKYALLRDGILRAVREPEENRVLITFGGGAAGPRILRLLEGLELALPGPSVRTRLDFAGSFSESEEREIRARLQARGRVDVEFLRECYNLGPAASKCEFAVTAAGSTIFELASLGVPMLVYGIVDNQRINAMQVEAFDMGLFLGDFEVFEPGRFAAEFNRMRKDRVLRERFSKSARSKVDGQGRDRVLEEIGKMM